jgi:predicted DNA-binding transcriptional regulator AlpA
MKNNTTQLHQIDLLDPSRVMQIFGYKDRASFYQTVRKEGIPHLTINSRRILFPRPELEAWLAKRNSHGGLS